MPRSEQCLISVELANALRSVIDAMGVRVPEGDSGFLCPECKKPVKPATEGEDEDGVRYGAHFEHLQRNAECSLSHKRRSAAA